MPKTQLTLCKRRLRRNSDGEIHYTIKGDDIHLAIDMLKGAYEDLFDTAILISGDGDFTPLLRYVKRQKKNVELCYFKVGISTDLLKECSISRVINKKIANKFFYREFEKK